MAQFEDKVLHELDGIKEYDNPMPGWLMAIWWGSLIFSAAYLIFYALSFGEGSMEAEYRGETQKALAVTHIQPDIVVPIVQPPVIVPPPPVVPPSPTTDLVGMVMYVSEGTNQYLIYAGDFSYTSQPTWTTLALPPNFSLIEPVADGYDNIVYTPTNGSRLLVTGRRTIDTKHSIWECTNWTSIKGNPTPPAPSWTELVTYTVTTIGGATSSTDSIFGRTSFATTPASCTCSCAAPRSPATWRVATS